METKHNILVVDSRPYLAKITKEAFGVACEVISTTSREEGMERAKAVIPDMIILGYLEPRGTSFKLHKEFRECLTTKNIPLLVVDVRPEEHSRKGWRMNEGMQMEADDYISLPVEPAELREVADGILQRIYTKPMGLRDVLEQVEVVLKRMDKIEKLLVK